MGAIAEKVCKDDLKVAAGDTSSGVGPAQDSDGRPPDEGLLALIPGLLLKQTVSGLECYEMDCDKGNIEARMARNFVKRYLVEFLPSQEDGEFLAEVLHVVGEAVTNALHYCVKGICGGPMVVCGCLDDRLVIVVANSCQNYTRKSAKKDKEGNYGQNVIFDLVRMNRKRITVIPLIPDEGQDGYFVLAFTVYATSLL